jgi:murein DD-endopeptidase MepM/ murein hydrolase activator NlpD
MNLFAALRQRRQSAKGFGKTNTAYEADLHQTFILEPILTPSGLVDVGEDIPEVADLDIDLGLDADTEDGFDPVETDPIDEEYLAEANLEEIPFIENLDIDFQFESGYFTVGESGEVTIDYLFDGGEYQGELAIFSLEGMEGLEPGSEAFIQTAADRALSNSELGYIVISDQTEGARFSGELGETDKNSGDYLGAKSFQMKPGDTFGFMLVPKGKVAEVADNPGIDGAKTPLFSLVEANPGGDAQLGQIVDVTGDGNTFVFEDLRTDGPSDRDYNDIIFQVRGATGEAELMDDFVDPAKDWRSGDLGQAIIDYAAPQTDLDPTLYDFSIEDQPFVGVLDTGFSGNNPDLDYSRIQLGKDWVDGDNNPLLADGEGNEHGTHTLGLIAAEQGNNLGIDGLNDDAPLWVGRAIGSGQWHESLREFVDAAQDSGQPNAVINLSLDLTQIDGEGNVTTRYEFTPQEREAIEYARQNGVLLVAAAGNDGGVMSVLGQAAQEFDNILTVGAVDGLSRAAYSSYGNGLGLLAAGGTPENPVVSLMADGLGTMAGTSVATAQVTGAVSQVWAANPALSYRQVIEILQATATDLDAPGWDAQTGAGLLNLPAALLMAKATLPQSYGTPAIESPETWSGEGIVTPSERAANPTAGNGGAVGTVSQGFRRPYQVRPGDSLRSIAVRQLNDGGRWAQIQRVDGSTFGAIDAALVPGDVVYLPVQYQQGTGTAVGTARVSIQPQRAPMSIGVLKDIARTGDYQYTGTVSKNAPVYYRFRLDKTRGFDFALRDFNQDLEIEILDANGNIIATGKDKVSEKIASTQLFGNQLYFARVTSTSDTPSNYRLVLNPGSSLGDQFASDDSIGFLTDRSRLGDYVESDALDGESANYYRFRIVDANRGFIFALRNLTADANVYLLDEDGNILARGRDTNNPSDPFEKIADFDLFEDQLYFIQVSSPNGTPTDYDLVLNPTGDLGSDVSNESSLGFINEPKRKVFHGMPGDTTDYFSTDATDYYRFRVTKEFETAIAIDNLKTQAALYLLDEKGNVITKRLSSVNGGKVVLSSQDLEKDKLYFIKVVAMDGLTANYDIIINPHTEIQSSLRHPLGNSAYTVTSKFGYRDESDWPGGPHDNWHYGIDLAAPTGTPIKAVKGGTVVRSLSQTSGYGKHIYIDHGDGVQTRYAHLSQRNVFDGQEVRAGDIIGKLGNTGFSTGPHLHFEYRVNGVAQNPQDYIDF